MRVFQPTCGLTALLAILTALPSTTAAEDDDDGIAFFEEHIRPVLVEYCYECHGADSDEPAGGLRLDHREGMRSGGELGPAVVPEDVDESLIISAMRYQDLEMPPDEKLDDDIIEKFEEWIRMGAPDPREKDDSTPAPDVEDEERNRKLIATGLLALGSKSLNGGNLALDIADDQIDVISKSVMGLTVSCARCHDHKFDPIPTKDYYALAGIFRNTTTYYGGGTKRPKNRKDKSAIDYRLDKPEATESASDQKTAARIKLQRAVARLQKQTQGKRPNTQELKQELARNRRELAALQREQNDDAHAEYAFVAIDQQKLKDWPLQVRGDKGQNGPVVPRGFLSCVELPDVPVIGHSESGRRQLRATVPAGATIDRSRCATR